MAGGRREVDLCCRQPSRRDQVADQTGRRPARPVLDRHEGHARCESRATVRGAVSVSHQRALVALKDLEAAGVVHQITEGGYDRQYAADGLFELIEHFEEAVTAAPAFDLRS